MREPQVLRLQRRPLNEKKDYNREAREGDYTRLITEPTIVHDADTGEVVLVYLAPIQEDTRVLLAVLRHINVPMTDRMSGMKTEWRTFGNQPRNERRARYACTVSTLAAEEPTEHAVLCRSARVVAGYYERFGPATYDRHRRAVRGVRPQWTVEGGPFTSGIVNKNGQLPYHHDQTNFKRVWSGMLAFRQGVSGGYLAVPAYDLAVEVADKSLTLFDGAAQLHGVTPLTPSPVPPDCWRYTVVFYSRAGMVKCLRPGEEAQRQDHR